MAITKQEILAFALHCYDKGEKVALATVINTYGSSPQPVSSMLVIREDGHCLGSVSSGCVEGSVIESALSLMEEESRDFEVLTFSSEQSSPLQVALTCGGEIEILLELLNTALKAGIIAQKIGTLENRQGGAILTNLQNGQKAFYENTEKLIQSHPNLEYENYTYSALIQAEEASYFLEILQPKPKLLLIGAVHIAQSLAAMAKVSDFDVEIIDPRAVFATHERFPDDKLICDWPDEILSSHHLNASTALICLSHDMKIDDRALAIALDSACFYIGALGSRKSHEKRLCRLKQEYGFSDMVLQRVNGPVGLDIHAVSTQEIAISILAAVVKARRSRG